MLILVYFDWNGNGKGLQKWNQRFVKACEENGIGFKGLFSSMNEKWNFVWLIETDDFDKFKTMSMDLPRPQAMTHVVSEILIKHSLD